MVTESNIPARAVQSVGLTGSRPATTSSRIIRRAPTGSIPVQSAGQPIRAPFDPTPNAPATPGDPAAPRPASAITACALAIVGGWATAVVCTDLIASWWHSDRLFCLAVGFLSLVFAATTISGVIMVLLGLPLGRYLMTAGASVALLTFIALFIAGARLPWAVHAIPIVEIATILATLHPATKRWVNAG